MAVRSPLLSVVAVLTCLTLNETAACPTEHALVAPATESFSHDVEDESISTYIGELVANARSSHEGLVSNTEDGRRTSAETLSTNGRALIDVKRENVSSHVPEFLSSRVPDDFSAPDLSELTLGAEEVKHFLDIDDESVSTYIRETAPAAASVDTAPEARRESPPTILRELTNVLSPTQILNNDLDPATTASIPLDPWAVPHRRDETH
jgi:hypothetical protein